jgi:hypothetical protein
MLIEVDLEVNTEKNKRMLMYHHQNAGQNHDVKIATFPKDLLAKFIYLYVGMTVTNSKFDS